MKSVNHPNLMTNNIRTIFRLLSFSLILMLSVSAGTVLLSGCSSTADAAKKSKSKKKKPKENLDEEDSEADSEEKGSEKPSETEKNESGNTEKEAEKDEQHGDKKKDESGRSADQIWNDLIKGNEKFIAGKHTNASFISIRKQLTKGQKPEVIILGCADSRVPPELVFDKNLGELFVVRAAGNIADPISLGSIEYAVEHLHSKVIVILGHESCGAVAATVSNEKMPTKNLSAIVNKIAPALESSKSCPLGGKMNNSCVELNVQQSAKDVLANSPIIKKAVKEGELTIIRAVYELESGKVVRLD